MDKRGRQVLGLFSVCVLGVLAIFKGGAVALVIVALADD